MRHPLRAVNPPVQSTTHRTDHNITTTQPTLAGQDPTCCNPSHKTHASPRWSLHSVPSHPSSVLKGRYKRNECALEDGHGDTFSVRSILEKIGWPTEKHFRTIAIRTPQLMRICINDGLSIAKKNHKLQHGDCKNIFTKSVACTKKTEIRSSHNRLSQELPDGQESVMKKESLWKTLAHLSI